MKSTEFTAFLARLATVTLFVLGLYAVYTARDIVVSVLLSGLLVAIVSPLLTRAEKRWVPTWLALVALYLAMLGLVLLMLFAVVPILSREFLDFANVLKDWAKLMTDRFAAGDISSIPGLSLLSSKGFDIDRDAIVAVIQSQWREALGWLSGNFAAIAGGFGSGLMWIFWTVTNLGFTLVLAFFLALERNRVYKFVLSLLPESVSAKIENVAPEVDRVFLVWLKGQFLLSCAIFLAVYVWLYLLEWVFGINIRGHFSLAFIAGLFEFIPVIGPILASIPAIIIALSLGPIAVGAVVLLYFITQQVENLFLVPRIQWNALELSTFTVLVAMAIAGSLFWILGVLFTLPVLAALKVTFFPQKEPKPVVSKPKNIKK